jgi:protein tyrosine phosphatase
MLCGLIEKDRVKCHNYWEDKKLENISVNVKTETRLNANMVVREIELKIKEKSKTEIRLIKQLHYFGWPDHGVPEVDKVFDVFEDIIKEINEYFLNNNRKYPCVVHCSAGVGRTGTFLALYHLNNYFNQQSRKTTLKFNIWNLVRKLKEQRLSSVENVLQYNFIYSYTKKYLLSLFR